MADQFVRHIATKPPDILTVPYEKLRVDIAQKIREESAAEIGGGGGDAAELSEGGDAPKVKTDIGGLSPSQMKSVELYIAVNKLRKKGMGIEDACDAVGFKPATYTELRRGRTDWFNKYMGGGGIPLAP